ncbi:MAG: DMT family transporter [Candidatus Thermoplasmatota archaeon]|jgi:drug/metabolite transporter (DMT)-like permease|nr:DMT family transporter [Candidatus Thermoplasmatota archaeon]
MDDRKTAISLLLVLISLIWAGSFIAVKVTVDEIPPSHLGFLRFLVATPIMVLLIFLLKKDKGIPIKKEFLSLIALGLTGVTLLYVFQFIGIEYTTASTSSVLINTNVVFIVLLSTVFLKESFTFKKTFGVIISFVGVATVVFAQSNNETIYFNNQFIIGCVLVLVSAFCWASYSVVGKRLLERYDPFTVTTYAFIFGTIMFLPFVFIDIVSVIQKVSFNGWMAVLYLAVFCSVFGYIGWYYALSKVDAGKAAVFLNFIPLFTIILSLLLMREVPNLVFLVGASLIIFGVYLAQRR